MNRALLITEPKHDNATGYLSYFAELVAKKVGRRALFNKWLVFKK